jgi:hypothetical protein
MEESSRPSRREEIEMKYVIRGVESHREPETPAWSVRLDILLIYEDLNAT